MRAVITLAKDTDFHWALWYGKCPRSFDNFIIMENYKALKRCYSHNADCTENMADKI